MIDWLETYGTPPALIVAGGAALWWGGEKLVDHAAHLAASFRVPKHVVGAVVLGFGTSLPELLVCLNAALTGEPGIAVGNIVGSNIANVGLILGIAALLSPVLVDRKLVALDLPLGLLAALGLLAWAYPDGGEFGLVPALLLLVVFAAYMFTSIRAVRSHRSAPTDEPPPPRRVGTDVTWLVIALTCVALGADVFVEGAKATAALFDVPAEVMGLSIVAFGTSLPELVTTVAAARQGHPELAVGNVAGSNIFNVLFVLGTTSAVLPMQVTSEMTISLIALSVFALLAFPLFSRSRRIPRPHGVLLLVLYSAYFAWLFMQGRVPVPG